MARTDRSLDPDGHRVLPFPRSRRIITDGGRLAARHHTVNALLEADVTRARQAIREERSRTGSGLSLTAFLVGSIGRAIAEQPDVQAYRDWRSRLVVFDHVDVNTQVASEVEGRPLPVPHLFRSVDARSFRSIHDEIRAMQGAAPTSAEAAFMRWFGYLPWFSRSIFYRALFLDPRIVKRTYGTVGVSAVGMFGRGAAWGIGFGIHTLEIMLGGISKEPRLVDGGVEEREILHLTLAADHDIVDGAPLARFAARLVERIEQAEGLGL
jgi:pyruvate/2-oxoglutarate dehydrogenase complex dihydrolipoamide acyltransferase (E2) component